MLCSALIFALLITDTAPEHRSWRLEVEQSFRRAEQPPPQRDPDLDLAAKAAALSADDVDLRTLARQYGVHDGLLLPMVLSRPNAQGMRERLDTYIRRYVLAQHVTHYGIAHGDHRLALIFVRRSFELDAVEHSGKTGNFLQLTGRLMPPYGQPELVVARPDETVINHPIMRQKHGALHASIPLDRGHGHYILELLAHGPFGKEVVLLLPIMTGSLPKLPTIQLQPQRPDDRGPHELHSDLLKLINQARRRHGLRALKRDARLERTARTHALAMSKAQLVAHVLPGGQGAEARLAKAGVVTSVFYENVALGSSIEQGHADLWGSPSHRQALLDARITHVGIAVVPVLTEGRTLYYIVEHAIAR